MLDPRGVGKHEEPQERVERRGRGRRVGQQHGVPVRSAQVRGGNRDSDTNLPPIAPEMRRHGQVVEHDARLQQPSDKVRDGVDRVLLCEALPLSIAQTV
jgi:hypothetical protein